MTFCPEESPPVSDPMEDASSILGEVLPEMSPASEQEACAPSAFWDLAVRPPNCS